MATRSTTPRNPRSVPMGNCRATTLRPKDCCRDSMERSKLERSRSIQVRTKARGMSYSRQKSQSFSVVTCAPTWASTQIKAQSAAIKEALVSLMKVPYPGISRKFILTFAPEQRVQGHSAWARAVCVEILRAISSSSKSVVVVPSATFPQRGVIPAVKSNDDTSCVFPVPPWPTMPTLRMSLVRYVFIQTSQSAPLVARRRGPCFDKSGFEKQNLNPSIAGAGLRLGELNAGEGERGLLLHSENSP